jgi:hypothetical protein
LRLTPGKEFAFILYLSPQATVRLNLAVIAVWLVIGLWFVVLANRFASRLSPAAGDYTIGLIVLACWASQLLPFLKRERSLLGAAWDGLLYAIVFGSLAVAGFRYFT